MEPTTPPEADEIGYIINVTLVMDPRKTGLSSMGLSKPLTVEDAEAAVKAIPEELLSDVALGGLMFAAKPLAVGGIFIEAATHRKFDSYAELDEALGQAQADASNTAPFPFVEVTDQDVLMTITSCVRAVGPASAERVLRRHAEGGDAWEDLRDRG